MNGIPKTRRLSSRRSLATLAVVGILGVGVWLALPSGLRHHWLEPAPQLDPATPRVQGGYTLAEVHLEGDAKSRAAAYVLIKVPSIPDCTQGDEQDGLTRYWLKGGPTLQNRPSEDPHSPIVQATGQTSDGDVLPLLWEFVGDSSGPKYLRVDIPGGYSNTCRFMDITLVTRTGAFPKWRVSRLPTMRRAIPDSPALQTSQTVQGIPISARAWRMRDGIYLQILPILPPNSHQWEIGPEKPQSEWEKFDQPPAPSADALNTARLNYQPIEGRNGRFSWIDSGLYGSLMTTFPADYRSASRFVRLDCGLIQFETLNEKVTFPHVSIRRQDTGLPQTPQSAEYQTYYLSVPKAINLITPSGIIVTLPAQGNGAKTDNDRFMGGDINLRLSLKPTYSPGELPQSPLVRQFGKAVEIQADFASVGRMNSWTNQPGETQSYGLNRPLNPKWRFLMTRRQMQQTPRHLPTPRSEDLAVIVRQRTEIQTIPLSFTVPVADTPPPDFHR